jgi:hypothetical protein
MISSTDYAKLLNDIKKEFPDFMIVKKTQSKLMTFINGFLKVITFGQMKTFMDSFVTTIGNTVYVPDSWDSKSPAGKAITIRHERVHMQQSKKYGRIAFSLLYLLTPLPTIAAYYRTKFEKEAYEESLKAYNEYYGKKFFTQALKDNIVQHFTTAEYFWMWPWKKSVEKWYDDVVEDITKNNP